MQDFYINVFIENYQIFTQGGMEGKWISLPIDKKNLKQVLESIGVKDGKYILTDIDTNIYKLPNEYNIENCSIEFLTEILDILGEMEKEKVRAYLKSDMLLKEILENSENLELIPVKDHIHKFGNNFEKIGISIIDEQFGGIDKIDRKILELFFDYESYGQAQNDNYGYEYTKYGVIRRYY